MAVNSEKKRRRVLLAILLIALLTIVVVWIRSCDDESDVEFVFSKVIKGEIVSSVYVSGKLDLNSSVYVRSNVAGVVTKVNVQLNEQVKKGKVLAVIDSPDLEFRANQQKEELNQVTATLEGATEALHAKDSLFKDALIPENEYNAAKRDYNKALSAYRITKNSYGRTIDELRSRTLRSPASGQVIQITAVPSTSIPNGAVLFQIAENMRKMDLILNIDESDVGRISTGKKVEFSVSAYPNKTFFGKIRQISMTPVQIGNMITYTALGDCDNSSLLLKPGMSITASIFMDRISSALSVPNEAFTASPVFMESTPGKKFVWKKKKSGGSSDLSNMERVEVKVGLFGGTSTQIISGDLKEGDEVLVKVVKKKKGKSIPGL